MRGKIIHIVRFIFMVFAWTVTSMTCSAQEVNNPYYFEGEDVVFVFDVRNYAKALLGEMNSKLTLLTWGSMRSPSPVSLITGVRKGGR